MNTKKQKRKIISFDDSWKTNLISKLKQKGYTVKKKTRMNYILELIK